MPGAPDILIVEDSRDDAELEARTIHGWDPTATTRVVADAPGLRAALDARRPDVVLSDHAMPGFDSAGVLAIVHAVDGDIPVIVVSGSIGEDALVDVLHLGATDYVGKEGLGRLPAAIERALAERAARADRDTAQARLRDSEARLRALFEHAADGIIVFDDAWRCAEPNPAACALLGRTAEDLVGRRATELLVEFPPPAGLEAWDRLIREGVVVADMRGLRPDGTTLEVELHGVAGFSPGRHLAIVHDIGPRKAAERELQEAHTRALEASTAKSLFLANMGHEIRTPLNGILGMLQLIGQTTLTDQQRGYLDCAVSSGEELVAMVNDVLDFSRIEARRMELRMAPFVVRDVVDGVARQFRPQAESRGTRLDVWIAPDVPERIEGDGGRVHQVLANLVPNAVKFTTGGSVEVLVSAPAADRVRVDVVDTGIGISQQTLGRLFEPFTQADASTTRQYGGTGLGLAISRQLTDLMGGEIGVESELGRGSRFWFAIPVAPVPDEVAVEEDGPAPSDVAEPVMRRSARVLVAEDNDVNSLVARGLLEHQGYDVDVARDGREAVEMVLTGHYAAVLMDCQMPRLDGYAATAEIRRRERRGRHVPIAAMTAHALEGDRERCLEAGMDDYIAKPVKAADLERLLRRLLASDADAPSPAPVRLPSASDAPLLDAANLDELGGHDPEAAVRLVDLYVAQTHATRGELGGVVDLWDPDVVRERCHTLAGSSAMIGAERVAAISRELSAAAKRDDPEAARAVLPRLDACLQDTEEALGSVRARYTEAIASRSSSSSAGSIA